MVVVSFDLRAVDLRRRREDGQLVAALQHFHAALGQLRSQRRHPLTLLHPQRGQRDEPRRPRAKRRQHDRRHDAVAQIALARNLRRQRPEASESAVNLPAGNRRAAHRYIGMALQIIQPPQGAGEPRVLRLVESRLPQIAPDGGIAERHERLPEIGGEKTVQRRVQRRIRRDFHRKRRRRQPARRPEVARAGSVCFNVEFATLRWKSGAELPRHFDVRHFLRVGPGHLHGPPAALRAEQQRRRELRAFRHAHLTRLRLRAWRSAFRAAVDDGGQFVVRRLHAMPELAQRLEERRLRTLVHPGDAAQAVNALAQADQRRQKARRRARVADEDFQRLLRCPGVRNCPA